MGNTQHPTRKLLYTKERLLSSRGFLQRFYDLFCAPLRMIIFPDAVSKKVGLSSLEEERLRAVLPEIEGKVLDVGAGTNTLVQLYQNGIGVDVIDWGGGAIVIEDTRHLPFPDGSFDTITFVACLNHIPYRSEVLKDAQRVLRSNGKVIITMIEPLIGIIGHKLWWYSEDKHRDVMPGELMGMSNESIRALLHNSGFTHIEHRRFLYGMNNLFLARKA